MSATNPTPAPRDARADELRRKAFTAERAATSLNLRAVVEPDLRLVASIAREHANAAWNHLWLYLDGLLS